MSCTVRSRRLRPPPTGPASCETRAPSAHSCPRPDSAHGKGLACPKKRFLPV